MSVTIVSTTNSNAAPTLPDAAGGDVASGDDFANVLHGQLALAAVLTPAPVDVPVAAAVAQDDTESTDISTDGAFDATSLLATMAFVAPPLNGDASTAITDKGEPARSSATPTSTVLGASVRTDEAATLPADASPTAAITSDTAAKFAVAPVTVDDAPTAKKATTDSAADESALATENIHAASHAAGGKHTAHSESTLAVATPVRDPDWSTDFGQKIVWLASSETQSAQLTLNPPQMGPIEISLSIDSGNATVSFASANAEVRDAIETALPRLREMLASAGIELGQTNVGAESFRQQQDTWGTSSASRSTTDNAILAADSAAPLHSRAFATQRGNGLVDLFA